MHSGSGYGSRSVTGGGGDQGGSLWHHLRAEAGLGFPADQSSSLPRPALSHVLCPLF